jgi:predicted MFS family arabinose efflux permease
VSVSGTGIIDSMLEPFMKKETGATQMDVGITFLLLGLLYMIGNPIAGWVRRIKSLTFFLIFKFPTNLNVLTLACCLREIILHPKQ